MPTKTAARLTGITIAPILAATLLIASCEQETSETTIDDVTQPAGEAADAAAELVRQEVRDFRESMNREIAQLNREIELLGEQGADLADDAREAYERSIADLRERRDNLQDRIGELEVESREAWSELRSGLERSWQELSDAVRAAKQQFDEG